MEKENIGENGGRTKANSPDCLLCQSVEQEDNNERQESAKSSKEAKSSPASTSRSSEIINRKEFKITQKLSKLQSKTESLRTKLNVNKNELHLQEMAANQSFDLQDNIDDLALTALVRLDVSSSRVQNAPQPHAVSESKLAITTAITEKHTKLGHHKTIRELQQQVDCLLEILSQLTCHNPLVKPDLCQIIQSDPKFQQLDILASINTYAMENFSRLRQDSECSASVAKSDESEVSNTENVLRNISISADTTSTSTDKNKKRERKRGGRDKVKKIERAKKTQEGEHEALAKYINIIVAEYLGVQNRTELIAEYEFKGGINDLELYANRLVQAGFGRIVEEEIRINRKNNRQSFITMSTDREALERDGIILLPVARRYAFDGDIVRAFVMNSAYNCSINTAASKICEYEDPFFNDECIESLDSDVELNELDASTVTTSDNCPKSFVIAIIKQTESREIIGTISFKNIVNLNNEQRSYYKLKPHDMRVPMVYIPEDKLIEPVADKYTNDICDLLYLARVYETDANGHCIGELLQAVGKVGNLEDEIKAILLHNGFKDLRPYEERFSELFAEPTPTLSQEDLNYRKDLRNKCIFTIDPLTARDLDDAISVECLGKNLYEVGVHISDLSHYLKEDTELDNIVKNRATTIYLVTEVIHMLPQPLCCRCSLLPGEDKFAFSVFWRLDEKGEQVGQPSFTRSVINSCTQFAYEHAQKIIDNPNEKFGVDDFPIILNGYTPEDISQRVLILHTIAQQLRIKRYADGAISINNPKLRFNLDIKTGEPLSYEVEARQEANFLIEEFMLLANQTVAQFIYDRFPTISILRNHGPPLSKSMKSLREKLSCYGIEFNYTNSKAVYESMQRICRESKDPKAMDACLNTLLTKPMARAKYFCSEGKTDPSVLWHYALSIPIYTHFTSPIRRYPDVLVHRLLAAALNYCPPPKRTVDELHQIAKVCNEQKFNAKNASDESSNLFFKRFIKSKQSLILRAVVTEIFQHFINVVIIETGHAVSINYKMQKVLIDSTNAPAFIHISERHSTMSPVKLQLFSTVDVKLVIWNDKLCGFFVSPDLKQRQLNSIESSKKRQQQQQQLTNGPFSSNANGESNVKNYAKLNGIQGNEVQSNGCSNRSKSKPRKSNAKINISANKKERVYALKPSNNAM